MIRLQLCSRVSPLSSLLHMYLVRFANEGNQAHLPTRYENPVIQKSTGFLEIVVVLRPYEYSLLVSTSPGQ